MISIILSLALVGFLTWIVLQIPMPVVIQRLIIGLVCFFVVIYILQILGVSTGIHLPN